LARKDNGRSFPCSEKGDLGAGTSKPTGGDLGFKRKEKGKTPSNKRRY